jgi:hypothetical protein
MSTKVYNGAAFALLIGLVSVVGSADAQDEADLVETAGDASPEAISDQSTSPEGDQSARVDRSAPVPQCFRESDGFAWHCAGPVPNMYCTQIIEPSDPHTWNDNYFCSDGYIGMRWSNEGPIFGMDCTQIWEYSDPHTWQDNYLCVPPGGRYHFAWSSAGRLSGLPCVQWREPSDPDTWGDNYLCILDCWD